MPPSRHMPQQSTQVSPETPPRLFAADGGMSPGRGSGALLHGSSVALSGVRDAASLQTAGETAAGVPAEGAFRRSEDFRLERDMAIFSFLGNGASAPVGDVPFSRIFLEY